MAELTREEVDVLMADFEMALGNLHDIFSWFRDRGLESFEDDAWHIERELQELCSQAHVGFWKPAHEDD